MSQRKVNVLALLFTLAMLAMVIALRLHGG